MKIIFDKNKCINCGSCAVVCPACFEMTDDNKINLKDATPNVGTGCDELEVENLTCNEEAVNICPVQAITIK